MADIDQISSQIGSLTAKVDEAIRRQDAIFTKQDRMSEEVIEQRGAIKLLGAQLVEHKTSNASAHARFDLTSKDVEALKNRSKGFIVAITILGGGGGLAGIATFVKLFLGA